MVEDLMRVSLRAVIVRNGKILLVKERDEHNYETPGGGLLVNETLSQGFEREVLEETGYKVRRGCVLSVVRKTPTEYRKDIVNIHILFRAEIIEKVSEPTEDIVDVKWFTKEEIEGMMERGETDIHDKEVLKMFVENKLNKS